MIGWCNSQRWGYQGQRSLGFHFGLVEVDMSIGYVGGKDIAQYKLKESSWEGNTRLLVISRRCQERHETG